jgi:hypothetical protein
MLRFTSKSIWSEIVTIPYIAGPCCCCGGGGRRKKRDIIAYVKKTLSQLLLPAEHEHAVSVPSEVSAECNCSSPEVCRPRTKRLFCPTYLSSSCGSAHLKQPNDTAPLKIAQQH